MLKYNYEYDIVMNNEQDKVTELEILNWQDSVYALKIINNEFYITQNGKILVKYNDDKHAWIGIVNHNFIRILAPSLRDVVNQIVLRAINPKDYHNKEFKDYYNE